MATGTVATRVIATVSEHRSFVDDIDGIYDQ